MSRDVQDILRALKEYDRTPESAGVQLRLNLAVIILRHLKLKNWTQRDLANATSFKESFISRLLHSNANCTFDTAGRVFFALGVDARIEEAPARALSWIVIGSSCGRQEIFREDNTGGEKIRNIQTAATSQTTPCFEAA